MSWSQEFIRVRVGPHILWTQLDKKEIGTLLYKYNKNIFVKSTLTILLKMIHFITYNFFLLINNYK